MFRRPFALAAVGTAFATAALLSGCSTGSTSADPAAPSVSAAADAHAFPVTIHSALGAVTIKKQPTRIVALGPNDADNLLALGVVPVGIDKVSWGGNAHGTTPWFDAKLKQLGAAQPDQVSDADGIPYEQIAALQPDLILATNYSFTPQQYKKLSEIAPVVAYPGAPWVTTWQKSFELVGEAVGREAQAEKIEQQTEDEVAAVKQKYPQLVGKTFIFGSLSTTDLSSVAYYTPQDERPSFLTELGMKNAPIIEKLSKKGHFWGSISAERAAELKSDVFISYAAKPTDAKTFTDDPLVGQIPAIKAGRLVTFLESPVAEAGTVPTPLAIPYAIAHYVPKIAAALS